VLGAVAIAVVSLTACGGGTSGGNAAVQVGDSSISKATVDHWTKVEAVLAYKVIPRQPVPKGVVPDPPNYTACIASLEAATPKPVANQPKPAATLFKGQCRQRYEELQKKMLDFLITFYWMSGEIANQGVKITEGEVQQQLVWFRTHEFTSQADFQKYLAYTGMSISDVLFLMRETILTTKLQKSIVKKDERLPAEQRKQAFIKFAKEYQKKWTAKTNCHTGYVIPDCKQYTGT
jgi:foldase protein PrsA